MFLVTVEASSATLSVSLPEEGARTLEVFLAERIYFLNTISFILLLICRSDTIWANYDEFGEDLALDMHLLRGWVGVLTEVHFFYSDVPLPKFWTGLSSSASYDLLLFFVSWMALLVSILVRFGRCLYEFS